MKTSKIEFTIATDENKIPESIHWTAEDENIKDEEAKAIMVSVWDLKTKNTLRLDLWTKEMQVADMKQFFHQTLLSMSDTFKRSTNDQKMSATMKDFCDYFAEKMDLLK